MSSAKSLLGKNEFKRQKKNQQRKAKYDNFAQENMKAIQKLVKERCPLDSAKIIDAIEAFLKQAKTSEPLKLGLPPLHPAILSSILQNMALWIGNTNAKED